MGGFVGRAPRRAAQRGGLLAPLPKPTGRALSLKLSLRPTLRRRAAPLRQQAAEAGRGSGHVRSAAILSAARPRRVARVARPRALDVATGGNAIGPSPAEAAAEAEEAGDARARLGRAPRVAPRCVAGVCPALSRNERAVAERLVLARARARPPSVCTPDASVLGGGGAAAGEECDGKEHRARGRVVAACSCAGSSAACTALTVHAAVAQHTSDTDAEGGG
mmetsp:Transcript_10508/g.33278  ORF Transcript_10508/g.33278 Transcript_10508/m.33278 type:complete len:221 (-) Transcript_10508:493-1155(-)